MTGKLHDDIIEALPHDFVRRMRNWSRTMDGTPISMSSVEPRVDYTRTEQPLPLLIGEADDTHKAVLRLPHRAQECIAVFWTHEARSIDWMLVATPRLRMWALGPARFLEHLDTGHALLMAHLANKDALRTGTEW